MVMARVDYVLAGVSAGVAAEAALLIIRSLKFSAISRKFHLARIHGGVSAT